MTEKQLTGQDHPRTRGVYFLSPRNLMTALGSSPHARGLRPVEGDRCYDRGIIPARAGFTGTNRSRDAQHADHPRTRGVYQYWPVRAMAAVGSSPHARGLRVGGQGVGAPARIIPARAGFTLSQLRGGQAGQDHPRTRGVYRSRAWPPLQPTGSSPHARGLHTPPTQHAPEQRIIPARAGFTEIR